MKRTAIDIRNVPEDVRDRVYLDAADRGVSMNDVVVEILARRYGVPWEPTGYPHVQSGSDSDHWNLRVPVVVRDALRAHADAVGGTVTGCLLLALTDHYDLPQVAPQRRVKRAGYPAEMVEDARRRHQQGESIRSLSREYGVKRETLTKAIRAGGGA